ncbi:MAG: formylmethanofuran dehydrogenase subunit C [Candidatus Thiodiazotropha sp. (ex Ustalcina ferruginea)]|nr:formylmethanofuran dehydrogenase subunit C [Candidatus Thiodiazotropha sp. (ex Ustalcina ferruginea)]
MSALKLRLRQSIYQRIDMSPFTPQRLADMTLADIARLPLWQGNQLVACGDLFTLSGDNPQDIVIQSDSDRLDEIGSGMTDGSIHVEGCAGSYLGRSMRGGSLFVTGDVGIAAGCNMSAGTLTIAGNTGDLLGGASTGERQGMCGGKIIVTRESLIS